MKINLYRAYVDRPGNGHEDFFKAKSATGAEKQFKRKYHENPDAVDLLPDNYYEVMENRRLQEYTRKIDEAAREYMGTVKELMEKYKIKP